MYPPGDANREGWVDFFVPVFEWHFRRARALPLLGEFNTPRVGAWRYSVGAACGRPEKVPLAKGGCRHRKAVTGGFRKNDSFR